MVEGATRPLQDFDVKPAARALRRGEPQDLFVWFEDTSARQDDGLQGIAGLPECLLPASRELRVVERHYTPGHAHLLAAVRLRCDADASECIAAIYTAALSVGTVAWIGTGAQYEMAWTALYSEDGSAME